MLPAPHLPDSWRQLSDLTCHHVSLLCRNSPVTCPLTVSFLRTHSLHRVVSRQDPRTQQLWKVASTLLEPGTWNSGSLARFPARAEWTERSRGEQPGYPTRDSLCRSHILELKSIAGEEYSNTGLIITCPVT